MHNNASYHELYVIVKFKHRKMSAGNIDNSHSYRPMPQYHAEQLFIAPYLGQELSNTPDKIHGWIMSGQRSARRMVVHFLTFIFNQGPLYPSRDMHN